VICVPQAMSDHEGVGKLYLSKSDMSASLCPDFENSAGVQVDVPTTTLDAYLSRHPTEGRLLIKVDVEGHEAAFFRGAARTLEAARPDIITEVTCGYDAAIIGWLRHLGYQFYKITDEGLLPAPVLEPVVRGRFVFLNYLLSTKSPAEAAELFARIKPAVSRLDLRKTSKYLTQDAVDKFTARSAELSRCDSTIGVVR
jgi:hypothetical protein